VTLVVYGRDFEEARQEARRGATVEGLHNVLRGSLDGVKDQDEVVDIAFNFGRSRGILLHTVESGASKIVWLGCRSVGYQIGYRASA
jgi:hypothetical protein